MIGNVIQRLYLENNDYPQASALSLILMVGILVSVVRLPPRPARPGADR